MHHRVSPLKTPDNSSHSDEHGFVAIVVASILMVILTLITIGFTQIMQREQRQALDRQLSTQAYYAAESGVNDFYAALQASFESGVELPKEKFTCDTTDFPGEGKLDGDDGSTSYTCLQYDTDPPTLEYNNGSIETNQSKVIPVKTSNGENINSITIGWEHYEGDYNLVDTCTESVVNFPPSQPDKVPLMRLDILRLPASTSVTDINQAEVINETPNLYFSPQAGSCGVESINYTDHDQPNEKGQIIQVKCEQNPTERDCKLTINTDSPVATDQYIIRLRSIYANANVTISATDTTTAGKTTELKQAQVLVDSTGKANDVVRRVQVRIQAIESQLIEYSVPESVFQVMNGFCKTLTVIPTGSVNVPNGRVDLNLDACDPTGP